jgi:hypothetical protein
MNISSERPRHFGPIVTFCRQLYARARHQEDDAPRAPHWTTLPASVEAHRASACMLRAVADCHEFESRPWGIRSDW